MDSGMFLPMQLAAAEALGNPDSWYEEVNAVYLSRRKVAEEIMNLIGCSFDSRQTGLFLWGRLPDKIKETEKFVDELLLEAKVFITPGLIFGENGKRYIRISLCATRETLDKAKNRIKDHLNK